MTIGGEINEGMVGEINRILSLRHMENSYDTSFPFLCSSFFSRFPISSQALQRARDLLEVR